jgi:hypothetical protein
MLGIKRRQPVSLAATLRIELGDYQEAGTYKIWSRNDRVQRPLVVLPIGHRQREETRRRLGFRDQQEEEDREDVREWVAARGKERTLLPPLSPCGHGQGEDPPAPYPATKGEPPPPSFPQEPESK